MANLIDNVLGNSIENLKSSIVKHGGVAQENRFAVYMTPPNQIPLNLDLNAIVINALSGGKFNEKSLFNDPRDIAILCESCTLPGRQILTADYQSIKQSVKVPYGFINEDVTFTFLLTNDYYIKKMFDTWSDQIINYSSYRASYMKDYVTDVTIVQLNKKNLPIYKVVLQNAYPITFNPITLDNNAENTAQKFSVTLTYENFFVDRVPDEPKIPAGKVIIGDLAVQKIGVSDVFSDKPVVSTDKFGLSNLTAFQNSTPGV
jgi:hypothetical protein